jgi:hypothetical protein
MLGGELAALQAPMFDGHAFDVGALGLRSVCLLAVSMLRMVRTSHDSFRLP